MCWTERGIRSGNSMWGTDCVGQCLVTLSVREQTIWGRVCETKARVHQIKKVPLRASSPLEP